MINSKLDVSNLSASKPSFNKKADLSFNDSQSNGFGKELASFQSGEFQFPANSEVSNLEVLKSPNQVSEENEKILTENSNNFFAMQTAVPNFKENTSKSLDDENKDMTALMNLEQLLNSPSTEADAAKVALQGIVVAPLAESAKNGAQGINAQAQSAAKISLNLENLTQADASSLQNMGDIPNQPDLKGSENISAISVDENSTGVTDKAVLDNQKSETDAGKFSLEGFQAVAQKTLSPELMPVVAETQASSETVNLLQKMTAQSEAPAMDLAENSAPTSMPAMFAMPQQNQTKNESGDSKEFSSKEEERSVEISSDTSFGHITEKHKATEAQVKTADAAVALPTEAQHKNNMDQIVTHARTFLKDGGGEMIMKLTPEGLGTVDLKVAVKDGQVSIEINTQNEHVRKMFEDGAKDLRGALEVQNLRVDTVKVNMAEHASKNMNMNQSNMSDKDFARNFMGQFRDERQGLRNQSLNGVMDKFHSPAKEAGGLRPSGLAMGNSSRLNVIA